MKPMQRQKILIVDDRRENLFALRKVLAGVDADVVDATSGNEALAATLDHDFAVAILDVVMPGMSGYELAEYLRGDDRTRTVPIVFLTATHMDEKQEFKGYEAGGIDYIVKPYSPEVLLGKINVFLELDQSKRELARHRDHLETLVAERTANLTERTKELKCLYAVSSLVAEPCESIAAALRSAVDLIPPGWQYPEITRARIVFEAMEFASADFKETQWKQSTDIVIEGKTAGKVEVCYLEERPVRDEGPFLREEREMIIDIGRQLGVMIAHKQAAETMSASETRYRRLFESAKDGILILDAETGVIEDVNPFLVELMGFPHEQFLEKNVWDMGFLGDAVAGRESFRKLQLHGYVRHDDLPLETADGRRIDVEFVSSAYLVRDKKVIQCNIRDITARKRADERELLAREVLELLNRPRGASDTIHDILTRVRKTMGFEAVGIRLREGDDFPYHESVGFSGPFVQAERFLCERNEAGELVRDRSGNPVLECMCGNVLRGRTDPSLPFFTEGGSFWTNSTTQLLASTTEEDRQSRTRNRCNGEGYESVALIPLRSGVETIGLLQINDRRPGRFMPETIRFFEGLGSSIGIALARRESDLRYKTIFDGAADGIVVADVETKQIRFANPAFCRMFGYKQDEMPRLVVADLHPGESFEYVLRAFEAQVKGEKPLAPDIPCLREDGTVFHAEVQAAPIRLGSRDCLVGFFNDTTEHRQLEEQLRQSQKLEAVGRLAGGVAHDFNNLLSVITGHCDLMLMRLRAGDPMKRGLKAITEYSSRAAALTRQLLAFSRKQSLRPLPIDLNLLVADMDDMLRRLLREDIELHAALAADIAAVKADPGKIEQVIMNLAVNARDAMPQGGRLTVETMNVELDGPYARTHVGVVPGKYVMLAVSDTGCGMDEMTKARVFEPFFTTKGPGKGTGLGLSTAYGIVKQSGGNIWAYSEPGIGTTFKVYLPVTETKPVAVKKPAERERLIGRGGKVLLVEDDPVLREICQTMLEGMGFAVTAAENGGAALLAVEEGGLRPDLLITDVVMPGMSGMVLAERLQRTLHGLRVLYMSGYPDSAIVDYGILPADMHFIQKPFGMSELGDRIEEVLREGGAG